MTSPLKYHQLLRLLDLTRLTDQDNSTEMADWLAQTARPDALPAAFCVYPQFLSQTLEHLAKLEVQVPVATVVNFPGGDLSIADVIAEIKAALAAGASEIDAVLPYKALLAGDDQHVKQFMAEVRRACGETLLKVIIESGELLTAQQICKATEFAIEGGADFVKTSTGKVPVGVTLEAATIMLTAIAGAGRNVGFKASGGVRTVAQALELMQLYEDITGRLANPQGMRIGASALLAELLPLLQTT